MKRLIFSLFSLLLSGFVLALDITTAAQDSAPKYITKNGEVTGGLCVDIMRAIERIDPNIKFVGAEKPTPFKRIEIKLAAGEIDVFFGFSKSVEREESFRFVDQSLYPVRYVMAVRAGDEVNVKNFEDIRRLGDEGSIMALFGTADVDYLKSIGGLKIDESGKNLQSQFDKLIAGRGRFIYYHQLGLRYSIVQTDAKDKIKVLSAVFKEDFHYVAFSKHASPEKVVAVERALKKLKANGQLQAIFNTYVQF